MPRGILLIAGLAMFSAVSGQSQTTNPSATTTPTNGPFGGPILVTPSAGFPNPLPGAGISDAGRAGISNATNGIETTNTPASPETVVATPSASLSESTTQAPANEIGTSQPPVNDLGTSTSVVGASQESVPGAISLAEVSSRYKAEKGTRNAKVLSNEDVQAMLNNKSGVTMAGTCRRLALERWNKAHRHKARDLSRLRRARRQTSRTLQRNRRRINRPRMPPLVRQERLHLQPMPSLLIMA